MSHPLNRLAAPLGSLAERRPVPIGWWAVVGHGGGYPEDVRPIVALRPRAPETPSAPAVRATTNDGSAVTSIGGHSPEYRRQLTDVVIAELVRHAVAEEAYVYPTARKALPDGDQIADHEIDTPRPNGP
ncbi:hypothetical protein [Micromonospora sp. NBC_00617]|uniref:hypothetical protein n=1 Tax=Micromonospora sp. NBC_00617 TaxID=2903587 RepID=UPI0030E24841